MTRMFCGTRPRSILRSNVRSAADAPTADASTAAVGAISSMRRQSPGGIRGMALLPDSSTRHRLDIRDAVEHPARVVRRRYRGRVAEGRPHQATKRVVEARNRIPRSLPPRVEPERKPAVPGKILQLHGADEHRRIEALVRVIGDVLDAGREFGIVIFTFHGIADDDLATATDELGDEVSLQIDTLHGVGNHAVLEPTQFAFDALPGLAIDGIAEEE